MGQTQDSSRNRNDEICCAFQGWGQEDQETDLENSVRKGEEGGRGNIEIIIGSLA